MHGLESGGLLEQQLQDSLGTMGVPINDVFQ